MGTGRPLSEFLEEGRALFNAGRFFEAHERWEEAWLSETGPARLLLQGLIQVAAGFLKMKAGNRPAAIRLFETGVGRIVAAGPPPELGGFCESVRQITARLRESGGDAAPWPLLPPFPGVK